MANDIQTEKHNTLHSVEEKQSFWERRKRRQKRVKKEFERFFDNEASGAIVMLLAALVALFIANTGLNGILDPFWNTRAGFFSGDFSLGISYRHWIDDALMAIFFFVVGLEIKREFLVGELSTFKDAILPVIAALGGVIIPSVIYAAINWGTPEVVGWGIPVTTDIAFSLGILALLVSYVPRTLRVFMSALTITDDIAVILIIAIFYTYSIDVTYLYWAAGFAALMFLMNRMGVQKLLPYVLGSLILWYCFYRSGVHATAAGVLAAFLIPTTAIITPIEFTNFTRKRIEQIEACYDPDANLLDDDEDQNRAFDIAGKAKQIASPLQRLEHLLHPVSTYFILPVFALANAGIRVVGIGFDSITGVTLGIGLGLMIGKPVGITVATWLATRIKGVELPRGLTMKHIFGVGILGGVGFTMSILAASLAFAPEAMQPHVFEAKLGILTASFVSGIGGYLYLRFVAAKNRPVEGAACDIKPLDEM